MDREVEEAGLHRELEAVDRAVVGRRWGLGHFVWAEELLELWVDLWRWLGLIWRLEKGVFIASIGWKLVAVRTKPSQSAEKHPLSAHCPYYFHLLPSAFHLCLPLLFLVNLNNFAVAGSVKPLTYSILAAIFRFLPATADCGSTCQPAG